MSSLEDRRWAMLCHLGALTMYFGLPFGNVIAPAVIWALRKEKSGLVVDQARESLNFQLSVLLAASAAAVLMLIGVGIPLLVALAVFDAVMVMVAATRVREGQRYRYPYTIRFIPS